MDKMFQKFAAGVSQSLGSLWTFVLVLTLIFISGAIFGFSEDWQRIVEFTITIFTFLLLFFLQKSQNVGDKATHAKLDELIRSTERARNEYTSVEDRHEHEIDRMKQDIVEECETEDEEPIDEDCIEAVEKFDRAR